VASWKCAAGSTILIPSGPLGNHLFVVVIDPSDFDGHPKQSCISVSICSIRDIPYDKTCIVQPLEHPFIKHPSYVSFRNTRIDMASHLEKMASDQSAFPQVDTSLELLTKIRSGILASKQTPNFYKLLLTP